MPDVRHSVESARFFAKHNRPVYQAVRELIVDGSEHRSKTRRMDAVALPYSVHLVGGPDQLALLREFALVNGLDWSPADRRHPAEILAPNGRKLVVVLESGATTAMQL